jgi:nucleolar protein 15
VEFASKDVAEIVAETMDGYLIHPHRLVCKVVEVDENVWKGANKVFKRVPWQKINREKLETKRTKENWENIVRKDDERSRKRAERIKELGIEYEFQPQKAKRKAGKLEETSNKKSKVDSKENKGKEGISKEKSSKKKAQKEL